MNKDASTRELRRQAVEMILEAVSLTDGLDEPTETAHTTGTGSQRPYADEIRPLGARA